jgi:hypothetical protein
VVSCDMPSHWHRNVNASNDNSADNSCTQTHVIILEAPVPPRITEVMGFVAVMVPGTTDRQILGKKLALP